MRGVNFENTNSNLAERISNFQNRGKVIISYKEGITTTPKKTHYYVKPFVYHGFDFNEKTIESILKNDLRPTYSYKFGYAIYSKLNPHKTIGFYYNHDALISIYHNLKHLEDYKLINHNKDDWILFQHKITPKSFLYIAKFDFGESKSNQIEINKDKEYNIKNLTIPLYIIKTPNLKDFDFWKNNLDLELGNISATRIKELNKPSYKVPVKISSGKLIDYRI